MNNPESIHWRPWGDEAFIEGKRDGKLIFLSISASWCHWCHILDQESFAHPDVIRQINSKFIPIRVDSDKRPDINNRYNMGGWPTIAILSEDAKIITGSTYIPTRQVLDMVGAVYRKGQKTKDDPSPPPPKKKESPPAKLNETMIQTTAVYLEKAFDPVNGGFGGPPKFPQPWMLEFSLLLGSITGETKWMDRVKLTLDIMRGAEVYDPIDGGFFRYATRGDWDKPHYEKLLDINAQMLSIYLTSYSLTGEVTYRVTAQGILDYLFTTLAVEEEPWFCGSQSADGYYYHLPEEERIWANPPALDSTIYTNHNALVALTLLKAYPILKNEKYRDRGLDLIEFLWDQLFSPQKGMYHYNDGNLSPLGYLSDQVQMIHALLDGFETTGQKNYLEKALMLESIMDKHLRDKEAGGYFDLPEGSGEKAFQKVPIKPFVENAIAAMASTRLFYLTGDVQHKHRAENTLGYLSNKYEEFKHHAAPFGLALTRFFHPPQQITIVGNPEDPQWKALHHAALQIQSLWKTILPLDVKQDSQLIKDLGYKASDQPMAYVCVGKTCYPPVAHTDDLAGVIKK